MHNSKRIAASPGAGRYKKTPKKMRMSTATAV